MCRFYQNYLSYLLKFGHQNRKNKIKFVHVFGSAFGFDFGAYVKALIGFKAFYFFGSVSVRFRCVCEMALTDGFLLSGFNCVHY